MSYRLSRRALGRFAGVFLPCLFAVAVQAADEFAVSPAQMQSLGVQLQRLEQPSDIAGLTYPARVVLPPGQEQVASAPLAGVVDQLLVAENDAVKAGQPLLRLISPELGELQLKLMEVGSRNRLSAKTLQRERQLFAEGIIPERRVLEAEATAAEDQARRRQAEAALRLAGVDDATIRRVADGGKVDTALTLRSRTAGLVTDLDVKPGQRVQQADALLRIADTRRLSLDIQIPSARQAEAASAKGAPIAVVGRDDVHATVASVSTSVNDSQMLTLRADVTRGAQLLRPGDFLQVRVPFAATGVGWPVPLQAVVRQGEQAYLFVRTEKGFVAKPVTVLASAGQSVQVKGELQAGQEIATASVIALKAAWQGKGGSN